MFPLFTPPTNILAPPPPHTHSASHAVVSVKLWLDVADATQQLAQHRLPVTTVTRLDTTHSLGRVAVHLHCAVAMRTEGLWGETQKCYLIKKLQNKILIIKKKNSELKF